MHSIGRYTMQAGSYVMLKQGIISLRGKPWPLNGHAASSICTCGCEFEIHTDHKALIQVYGGQAKPRNARLVR